MYQRFAYWIQHYLRELWQRWMEANSKSGGRVNCGCTREQRLFLRNVNKTSSCWLWEGSMGPNGYGRVVRNKKNIRDHRFSYTIFKGPIPKGLLVCHSCDIKLCVKPDHLWAGTSHDNIQDAYNKGSKMGFRSMGPSRKLTANNVIEMRSSYIPRIKGRVFYARKFGVSRTAIDQVIQGMTWKHIRAESKEAK